MSPELKSALEEARSLAAHRSWVLPGAAAVAQAEHLLARAAAMGPPPQLQADPDGCIVLEWEVAGRGWPKLWAWHCLAGRPSSCTACSPVFTEPDTSFPMSKPGTSSLVYSTDGGGRMCPDCRRPAAACICRQARPLPPPDGVVRVSRETKGRKGKGVTLVKGAPLDPAGLALLGKQLKASCGSGGTVKDGVIEVQGDHVEQVMALLKQQQPGWVVKRVGG